MNAPRHSLTNRIFWGLAALCLLPWFVVQIRMSISGDTAWLVTAASRLLDGGSAAKSFYDANPPLSTLYNLPPAWLARMVPVPEYDLIFFYFCAMIALSTFAINAILKRWPFLETGQRQIVLAAWLAANTIIATVSLGQRDPVALIGLMPFLLAQLSMTWGYALPKKLFWPVMVLGTVAALIKPHYGLLPVLLLVHRMIAQKRLWIVRDPDFLALAFGTVTYIAIVWFCFHDYVTDVLPDALILYASNKLYNEALPNIFLYGYLFLVFLGIEAAFVPLKGRQKQFLILLYAGAVASLVPYAVQMKGFYYHLVPALTFFFCAFSLSLHCYAHAYLKNLKYLGGLLVIAVFVSAYIYMPLLISYPKHKDYKTLPLSKEIAKCEKPCPYFILSLQEIVHTTAFYDGTENASRFPSYWFLPGLAQEQYKLDHGQPATLSRQQIDKYRKKFGDMTAEDLEHYKPKMLLLQQYRLTEDPQDFDFPGFFSVSPAFVTQWAKYHKDRTITINRRPYFAGTAQDKDMPLSYDIYLRN